MKWSIVALFVFHFIQTFAQRSQEVDSLLQFQSNVNGIAKAKNNIKLSKQVRNTDLQLAEMYNKEAIAILEKGGADSLLAIALIEQAIIHSYQSEFDTAFELNHRGLQLARKFRDTLRIIDAFNNLGIDYYYLGEYEKALNYFEEVERVARMFNEPVRRANSYNNLGLIYSEMGDYESERNNYLRAKSIFDSLGNKEGMALTELNLGATYILLEEFDKARKSLTNAFNIYDALSNETGKLDAQSSLISLLQKEGKLMEATEMAENGYHQCRLHQYKSGEIHFLQLLEELYTETNQYQRAYEVLAKRKTVEDSLLNEQTTRSIAELETQYETARKEKEISSLALENERVNFELEARNNQIRFYVAAIVILFLLAGFIAWRYRYKQKLNRILQDKHDVISTSLKEREVLLKEIHHRVKNNLQIISSLLSLQSRFIKDKSAIDAVKEGRNRVKSMAMIHQKLYQHDDVRGVKMDEYVRSLTHSLTSSYRLEDHNVNVEVEVVPLILDIDSAIPLGLILNELLTNAFKYAFPDERVGNVLVKLKRDNQNLILEVSDDGIGRQLPKNEESFGMSLIESLASKLKADMKMSNGTGTGYTFTITNFQVVA